MRRSLTVAVALVALLVVSAHTGAAAGLIRAGEVDTESEFNNGTIGGSATVETVDGTGAVVAESGTVISAENDGFANEWTGDTNYLDVTTGGASGAISPHLRMGTDSNRREATKSIQTNGEGVQFYVKDVDQTTNNELLFRDSSGATVWGVFWKQNTGIYWSTAGERGEGEQISGLDGWDLVKIVPDYANDEATIYVNGVQEGTFSFHSSGGQPVEMTAATNGGYIDDGGGIDDVTALGGGSGTYTSPGTPVSGVENAHVAADITDDAELTVRWQEKSGGSWSTIKSQTLTSSDSPTDGTFTFDLSNTDGDRWRLDATLTANSGSVELKRHYLEWRNDAPTLDESSADPTGDTDPSATLSINVDDPQFNTPQGDRVTVEFYRGDGTFIGSQSRSSAGSVSVEPDSPSENFTWYASATDEYGGGSGQTTEFIASVPSELQIYNESAPSSLVQDATIEVQFYGRGSNFTTTKSTSDGTVEFSDIPGDEQFIVIARADGYYDRRVYVKSLYDQQRIYLLPREGPTVVENVFTLDDNTGRFPARQTTLLIQKPIQVNNETKYQTIAGDNFGSTNSFPVALERGQRYRLLVNNQDGDTRALGAYVARVNGTQTLDVGEIKIKKPKGNNYRFNVTRQVQETSATVTVRFADSAEATEELNLYLHETGNRSNVVDSFETTDPGNITAELVADGSPAKLTLTIEGQRVINGTARDISAKYPIRGGGKALNIPFGRWVGILGIVSVVFVASLATPRYAAPIMLATVMFAGLLMYLRVVEIWPPLWWFAAGIAALGVYSQQGGRR